MKKGDLRRQAILDTAEALFFGRGYEETSVQDILDAMGLSKGGFYHHFESKMAVLEAVSARRAEQKYSQAARELRASSLGALEKLNRLFSLVNIFEREQPEFVQMVLNVCFPRRRRGAFARHPRSDACPARAADGRDHRPGRARGHVLHPAAGRHRPLAADAGARF